MTISGEHFCAAIDAANMRLSLINSDGYLRSQWQFLDREDATSSHGATSALSTFIIVDTPLLSAAVARSFG
jgi:hypothetical protein